MDEVSALLAAPDHVWSIGTGAAMMAFVPSGAVRAAPGAWIADSGPALLRLGQGARLLAFETLSADPVGWNHGIALCVTGAPSPRGPAGIAALGPDSGAILPEDRAAPVFQVAGDGHASLLFRPAPSARAAAGALAAPAAAGGVDALSAFPGCWIVETALARIEQRHEGGGPVPVHITGAGPSRMTPLPPGWHPVAHVFPPHPARLRPGAPAPFDPARHAAFQALLARHGRPDLLALKAQVRAALAARRFEEIATDRHGLTAIRVTLRQWLAETGTPPEARWMRRYDRPLHDAFAN